MVSGCSFRLALIVYSTNFSTDVCGLLIWHFGAVGVNEAAPDIRYPRLERRIQAVLIDSVVLSVAFFTSAILISSMELNAYVRIAFVCSVFFLAEPALVAFRGATIGHGLRGLRIERVDTGENLGVVRATLRFLIKYLFGFLSLVFIVLTRRHQAIHDLASRSVVVVARSAGGEVQESLPERESIETGFNYPSKLRRIVVIAVYLIAGMFLLTGISHALLLTPECLNKLMADSYAQCHGTDREFRRLIGYGLIIYLAAIIVLGWRGRLWGCRKTKTAKSAA